MGATGGTSTTFSVLRSYHEFPLVSSRMDFRSIKCHPGVTGPPRVYLLLYLAQCQGRTPPFTRMEKSNKTEGDNLRQLPRCQECITFSPEGEDSLTCSTVRWGASAWSPRCSLSPSDPGGHCAAADGTMVEKPKTGAWALLSSTTQASSLLCKFLAELKSSHKYATLSTT